MNELGEMLRVRREQLGMTQTEVAELAGISNSFLCQLESGVRRGNNVRTVARLAGALKLRLDDVVGASIRGGMQRG
mgnify:CR=1 FL=1